MKLIKFIFLNLCVVSLYGQQINPDGLNKFYHANGILSAEGYLREGKPDGYWKNYYENGLLMSEGNRREFLLDSTWIFYSEDGQLVKKINYKEGKKDGLQVLFFQDYYIEENYKDDLREGFLKKFYLSGSIKEEIPLVNGKEHGIGREFNKDGLVITLNTYLNGIIVGKEIINRYDRNNKRQGKWKFFYDEGNLQLEGFYKADKKHGFFKQYSRDGSLLGIAKYEEDVLITDAVELVSYDLKYEYYEDGKVKSIASYKGKQKEGLFREFSKEGTLTSASIYEKDIVISKGLLNDNGFKDGSWVEYYSSGTIKSKGTYKGGVKVGLWEHYYENGNLEQKGNFNNEGLAEGEWIWYFDNNQILKIENFRRGLEEGEVVEYSREGALIAKGVYIEGKREYEWFIVVDGVKLEGNYKYGERDGLWKLFNREGLLIFEGSYIDGFENGLHKWYYDNKEIREIGNFRMGVKYGEWKKFMEDGSLFITIEFLDDNEIKVDGEELFKKGD